jgi:hypothetical protein
VQEELATMAVLQVGRLAEYSEERVRVTAWSTINVRRNIYSVPSRLIQREVTVRVFDDRLEVYHGPSHQLTVDRLHGESKHRIDYRHIIWSLVRKPNAFRRYKYREDLFPSLVFRRAYDTLVNQHGERKGDIEYLRLLHLAASTYETEVEAALELVLEGGDTLTAAGVKKLVSPAQSEAPSMEEPKVDLAAYDRLYQDLGEAAHD